MKPISSSIDNLFYDNMYYPLYCKIDDRTDAIDWMDVYMSLWDPVENSVNRSVSNEINPL